VRAVSEGGPTVASGSGQCFRELHVPVPVTPSPPHAPVSCSDRIVIVLSAVRVLVAPCVFSTVVSAVYSAR
jgi:hypothetical protein